MCFVVKAGEPHKFVSSHDAPVRQIDIHLNATFSRRHWSKFTSAPPSTAPPAVCTLAVSNRFVRSACQPEFSLLAVDQNLHTRLMPGTLAESVCTSEITVALHQHPRAVPVG